MHAGLASDRGRPNTAERRPPRAGPWSVQPVAFTVIEVASGSAIAEQTPCWQVWPDGHATPHAPQFEESTRGSEPAAHGLVVRRHTPEIQV